MQSQRAHVAFWPSGTGMHSAQRNVVQEQTMELEEKEAGIGPARIQDICGAKHAICADIFFCFWEDILISLADQAI